MTRKQLIEQIRKKRSFLCVGLDTDLNKIPSAYLSLDDPIFEFNKTIIDCTRDLCVAYKPNLAFYECLGVKGWTSFQKTVDYIGKEHFIIADAKRGDIGNTSAYYARTFFDSYACDAVTVAPYMGKDSVEPFLRFEGKWAIVLALTSNEGAIDFQLQSLAFGHDRLFEKVLRHAASWGSVENTMFVVGATRPEMLTNVRAIVPDHFLLVPGIGAQGGSLEEVCQFGLNQDGGLLINASRSLIYPEPGGNGLKSDVSSIAMVLQQEMEQILRDRNF